MSCNVKVINKLIIGISHNDEKALKKLFTFTKEKLYYIACKYLSDESKAEDILDKAYLKIYQNSKSFDGKSNGFNWMYEIVKNLALDQNREDARHKLERFDENYYFSDALTISIKRNKKISMILKSLDILEQRIIILKIWENKTLKQIAVEINMSFSTTYRLYCKALEKIKDMWDDFL